MGVCFATQSDAAFTEKDLPKVLLIFSSAIAAYVVGPIAWAALQFRGRGTRPALCRASFLLGLSSLSAILLWIAISRGVVFGFGPMAYLFLLGSSAIVVALWRRPKSHTASPGSVARKS